MSSTKRYDLWRILFAILIVSPIVTKGQNPTVRFSVPGGFYDNSFALELSSKQPGTRIFYTLNGDTPTVASKPYTGPLYLDSCQFSTSNIYRIPNSVDANFFLADDVKKCIVIRAAAFDANDSIVGPVSTNTYIISSLGSGTHGLPVVSIAVDSISLFDYETGIFVPGSHFDPADPTHTGNYYCKGDEWERCCNVEFYESGNRGINQIAGLRTRGGASRGFQQKGLKLLARQEEYGQKYFYYRFFEDVQLARFKRLSLKPLRCSNWVTTGGQEYICQKIARNLDVDGLAIRQVALFINGEYWGIYSLEETPDEHYLEDHFGVDPDSCNILKYWGVPEHGSSSSMWYLRQWLLGVSLADSANYEYISTMFDISNFIDYWLFEIFACNVDWPANNTMCWQETDGEWRCILYDLDGCFVKENFDGFGNAVDTIGAFPASNANSTLYFRKLLENESFRQAFRARYFELKQDVLSYSRMHGYLQDYADEVAGEIPSQVERFGFPYNVEKWQSDIDFVDRILMNSHEKMEEEISDYLSVSEDNVLGFVCFPNPSNGEMHICFDGNSNVSSEIEIYDILGQKVFSKSCVLSDEGNQISFNPDLTAGVYFLKINDCLQKIVRW